MLCFFPLPNLPALSYVCQLFSYTNPFCATAHNHRSTETQALIAFDYPLQAEWGVCSLGYVKVLSTAQKSLESRTRKGKLPSPIQTVITTLHLQFCPEFCSQGIAPCRCWLHLHALNTRKSNVHGNHQIKGIDCFGNTFVTMSNTLKDTEEWVVFVEIVP